jgi:multicomponent Na+:H+ antiporter subunit C
VSFLPYALAVWIFLVGLYGIVTSRNLIHITVCVTVCQSATYVLLLAIGYRTKGTAPVFSDIPTEGRKVVDPIVQSLTLTDIVVSVAVAALLLSFALKAFEHYRSLDPSEMELKG